MRATRGGRGFRGSVRGGRPYPSMHGPPRRRSFPPKYHVTHEVFDEAQLEPHVGKTVNDPEEPQVSQALLKRNQELTPNPAEQVAVQNLAIKVEHVIEGLILSAEDLAVGLEEVKMVGSYKKGTMLAGHPIADMVIVLKDIPTNVVIEQLAAKVKAKLIESDPQTDTSVTTNEGGFNVNGGSDAAMVRCLVSTLPRNLLHADPATHVDVKLLEGAIATVRHARWFEDNASHTTVRVLVRLLKDMKQRFQGLAPLSPWLIDLLAHRATMENFSREPLQISAAFRRVLKLLSSGIFLPGSIGLIDPCESGNLRAHASLGLQEQDAVCRTAQTLLRCLACGGFNAILGLNDGAGNTAAAIGNEVTTWNDVVVVPGEIVYRLDEQSVVAKGNQELPSEMTQTQ